MPHALIRSVDGQSMVSAAWRSRRGSISVAFAVAATALLGMAALATEGGLWLTNRRNAQNAADAGAYAAIVSLSLRGATDAVTAGTQVATRNGFTTTTNFTSAGDTRVTVQTGLWLNNSFTTPTPNGSSANAARVEIQQIQRIGLARMISTTVPIAWGGAIAVIESGGPACTLSIPPPSPSTQTRGQTEIGGSTTVNAPNCLIASNFLGSKSINIHGVSGSDVTVGGLRASGQCYGCGDVSALGGYVSGAPVTPDPYASVNGWSMPSFNGSTCVAPVYLNAAGQSVNRSQAVTIVPTAYRANGTNTYTANGTTYSVSRNTPVATCGNDVPSIGNGQTMRLQPGTYFFSNGNLDMTTGGTITCDGCSAGSAGVTLVFTGSSASNVGTLRITGGNFTLIAPGTGYGNPSVFDGIAIYRDDLGNTSNSPQDSMKITGNPNSTLFGGIYVPTGAFEMYGTSGMNQTTAGNCVAVVAASVTFSGNSAANIDACESNGTRVAHVQYVRFAQ